MRTLHSPPQKRLLPITQLTPSQWQIKNKDTLLTCKNYDQKLLSFYSSEMSLSVFEATCVSVRPTHLSCSHFHSVSLRKPFTGLNGSWCSPPWSPSTLSLCFKAELNLFMRMPESDRSKMGSLTSFRLKQGCKSQPLAASPDFCTSTLTIWW